MNSDIFTALELLEKEKGIPKDYMLEKISAALVTAYKRDHYGNENIEIDTDDAKKTIKVYAQKEVIDEALGLDPDTEIYIEDARHYAKDPQVGDIVKVPLDTMKFGRIAAQTAKQVIIQGIREAEQGIVFQHFTSTEHELISAIVSRVDPRSGNAFLDIGSGNDHSEIMLPLNEQVRGEVLNEGDRIRVYVVEVKNDKYRPRVLISRSHPGLVNRLFELNVPEIRDGIVEIKSISREAGSRTKMAVYSHDDAVDPVGACVGPRGERVNTIVSELRGEKIDIIRYSDDPAEYIAAALAPSAVIRVDIADEGKACRAIVPDDQLSLAIGREGQNARLAVKLTGYKIDIKPLSQASFE